MYIIVVKISSPSSMKRWNSFLTPSIVILHFWTVVQCSVFVRLCEVSCFFAANPFRFILIATNFQKTTGQSHYILPFSFQSLCSLTVTLGALHVCIKTCCPWRRHPPRWSGSCESHLALTYSDLYSHPSWKILLGRVAVAGAWRNSFYAERVMTRAVSWKFEWVVSKTMKWI